MGDPTWAGAAEIAAAVRARRVSPVEVMRATLDRDIAALEAIVAHVHVQPTGCVLELQLHTRGA